MSRTTAEEGAECIKQLTGPHREIHTTELAQSLIAEESVDNELVHTLTEQDTVNNELVNTLTEQVTKDEDDEIVIVVPESTNLTDECSPMKSITSTSNDLLEDIQRMDDPVVCIKSIVVENSNLIIQDDIDVKKEQLDEPKKVPFTEEEDRYIRDGLKKYGKKWAEILKDSEYKFHPSRKRDTIRVRANTLKGNKRAKRGGRK